MDFACCILNFASLLAFRYGFRGLRFQTENLVDFTNNSLSGFRVLDFAFQADLKVILSCNQDTVRHSPSHGVVHGFPLCIAICSNYKKPSRRSLHLRQVNCNIITLKQGPFTYRTTKDVGAKCRHDMWPSVQLLSVSDVDSELGLTMGQAWFAVGA